MLKIGENYTVQDLKNLYGSNWTEKVGYINYQKTTVPKKLIKSFADFDIETQFIYQEILRCILQFNSEDFKVWAYGSRVNGLWRTKEESEMLAKIYMLSKTKYSDYDFVTNAKILPTNQQIEYYLGNKVKVDGRIIENEHNIPNKVLIN